jgi:7-cyano-7-deazaguanine synthase
MTAAPYVIVLLSGGMDSAALLGHLLSLGYRVDCLAVDYGQRHHRELRAARAVAGHYGARFDVADLSGISRLLTGSALTDQNVPVPHGHYADTSMRATVVPNRNAILIMLAAGVAAARGAQYVATAVHAGDHPIYPDCRPEFITAADQATRAGTAGYGDVHVIAPFVQSTKAEIAATGARLGVPLHLTWSCYTGGAAHCGQCGTCTERAEAFEVAGLTDPTTYATTAGAQPDPPATVDPAAIVADGGWCRHDDTDQSAPVALTPVAQVPTDTAGQPS